MKNNFSSYYQWNLRSELATFRQIKFTLYYIAIAVGK